MFTVHENYEVTYISVSIEKKKRDNLYYVSVLVMIIACKFRHFILINYGTTFD